MYEDSFPNRITVDEMWVYLSDLETKTLSIE